MTPLATGNDDVLVGDNDDHAITTSRRSLRRAHYVRVVDLVPNIDINKVKAEMVSIDRMEAEGSSGGQQKQRGSSLEGSTEPQQPSYSEVLGVGEEGRDLGRRGKKKVGSTISGGGKSFMGKVVPPSGGFNMCLLVGRVDIVVDKVRVDKSRVRLAEVEVGDESGTVSLRARDEQIDLLEDLSSTDGNGGAVVLRNCTLELFQGKHLRVAVTKWGKMRAYPDQVESTPKPPEVINGSLNFSKVDLNIVTEDVGNDMTTGGGGMGRSSQRIFTGGQEYAAASLTMPGGLYHHHQHPYHYHQQESDDLSSSQGHTISSMSNMSMTQQLQPPGRQPPQTQHQHYRRRRSYGDAQYSLTDYAPPGGKLDLVSSGGAPYTGLQPLTPGASPSNPNIFSPFPPPLYGCGGSVGSGGSGSQQQQMFGYDHPLPPLILDAVAEGQQPQQPLHHPQHLGQQGIITERQVYQMQQQQQFEQMQQQQHQQQQFEQMQQQQQYEQMQLYHHQQQLESQQQPTSTFQNPSAATGMMPQSPPHQGSYASGDGNVAGDTSLSPLGPINSAFRPVDNNQTYNNTPIAFAAQDFTQQQPNTNFQGSEIQLHQTGGSNSNPTNIQPQQNQGQGGDFHSSGEYYPTLESPQTPHQVQQQLPPMTQHLYTPETWNRIRRYETPISPMNPKAASYDPSSQAPVIMPLHPTQQQQQSQFFHPQQHQQMLPYSPYMQNTMEGGRGGYGNYHMNPSAVSPTTPDVNSPNSANPEDNPSSLAVAATGVGDRGGKEKDDDVAFSSQPKLDS